MTKNLGSLFLGALRRAAAEGAVGVLGLLKVVRVVIYFEGPISSFPNVCPFLGWGISLKAFLCCIEKDVMSFPALIDGYRV